MPGLSIFGAGNTVVIGRESSNATSEGLLLELSYWPPITARHHEEVCVKKRLRKEVHVIAYPVLAKLVSKSGKSVWKKAERREPERGDFDAVEQQFQ